MKPLTIFTTYLLTVGSIIASSCNNIQQPKPTAVNPLLKDTVQKDTAQPTPQPTVSVKTDTVAHSAVVFGERIQGDFDGDGTLAWATVVRTKEGRGNPVEDGTPDEYTITFSSNKYPPLAIGCCDAVLINEGDLMGDKKDKLSVFQAPMNGNMYSMYTYAFVHGAWKRIIDPFLITTDGGYIADTIVQNLVFTKGKTVYINEQDNNNDDGNLKFIKKAVRIKLN